MQEENVPWRQGAYVAPRSSEEKTLTAIWSKVLGIENLGVDDNYFEIGGDSIQCIQIVARARQAGLHFTTSDLFENPTIGSLAPVARHSEGVPAAQRPAEGPVPFTPIQHWFFEQNLPNPHHWNQAVLLQVTPNTDPQQWGKAIEAVIERHDALRLRFEKIDGVWTQRLTGSTNSTSFRTVDLSGAGKEQWIAKLNEETERAHKGLHLSAGPVLQAVFFRFGSGEPDRFLVVIHHLVVDGVSFRTLVEDLESSYQAQARSSSAELPPLTTSFAQWARDLSTYPQSPDDQIDIQDWLPAPAPPVDIPLDMPEGENTEGSTQTISIILEQSETERLFQQVLATRRVRINDVLVTALADALAKWVPVDSLQVDLEGHGRDLPLKGADLTRTVGWFTSLFPVILPLGKTPNVSLRLPKVKQLLRASNRGLTYGILRYLHSGPQLRARPASQLVFNYLGEFDSTLAASSLLRRAEERAGTFFAPEGRRPYAVQVIAVVMNGRLEIRWEYSSHVHHRKTIDEIARNFAAAIRELIDSDDRFERLSPEDFPDAGLSQDDLDRLLQKSPSDGRE